MSNDNQSGNDNDGDGDDVAEPVFPNKGPGREEMVSEYLPGKDEWQAKTALDVSDPAAIAALREFGDIYPEVSELQPLIDGFLDDFMQTKISVKGKSRDEFKDILTAMYGGGNDDKGSTSFELVAQDDD